MQRVVTERVQFHAENVQNKGTAAASICCCLLECESDAANESSVSQPLVTGNRLRDETSETIQVFWPRCSWWGRYFTAIGWTCLLQRVFLQGLGAAQACESLSISAAAGDRRHFLSENKSTSLCCTSWKRRDAADGKGIYIYSPLHCPWF